MRVLKTRFHKEFIKNQHREELFDKIWAAREACIKALSENKFRVFFFILCVINFCLVQKGLV